MKTAFVKAIVAISVGLSVGSTCYADVSQDFAKMRDGASSLGHSVADESKSVGHKVADTSRHAGHAIADTARKMGLEVKSGAQKLKTSVVHDGSHPKD
jgi:hypothetical protein